MELQQSRRGRQESRLKRACEEQPKQRRWKVLRAGEKDNRSAVTFCTKPYTQFMPVFARDILNVGAPGLGLLLMAPVPAPSLEASRLPVRRFPPPHIQLFLLTSGFECQNRKQRQKDRHIPREQQTLNCLANQAFLLPEVAFLKSEAQKSLTVQ